MRRPIFLLLILIWGCASHAPIQAPKLQDDYTAHKNRQEKNGVVVMVKAVHSKRHLEAYYDEDLILYGIMPIQVFIQNVDSKTCFLGVTYATLTSPTAVTASALSSEEVFEKAKKSYGRTVGWFLAFGLLGGIPSAVNVSETNKKIKEDYESCNLKSVKVAANAYKEGSIFFPIDSKMESLDGWICKIGFVKNGDPFDLSFKLSGNVKQPR